MATHPRTILACSSFFVLLTVFACGSARAAEAPRTVESLWADYDPRQEPLDAKLVREWEEEGVVFRYVTYHIGTFKGVPARMAAFYAFPKSGHPLPGLPHLHGGGQRAFLGEASCYARRGYACLSINWGGREMENAQPGDPNTDWGAVDPTQRNVPGYFTLKPGPKQLDPVERVSICYSLDPEPRARFWRSAEPQREGNGWWAKLPLMSLEQPLFVFANVSYRLDKPEVPIYSAPTQTLAISSLLHKATAEEWKRAEVLATNRPSMVIEDFSHGFRDWYLRSPFHGFKCRSKNSQVASAAFFPDAPPKPWPCPLNTINVCEAPAAFILSSSDFACSTGTRAS